MLMQAVARGDENAYRKLVRRHLGPAVRLATRILGSPAAAEDAAQEAFIRVWKHAARFEDPAERGAKFSTWLYRIVVNLCIDEKRKARWTGLDALQEQEDDAPAADRRLEQKEQSRHVRAAIDALPGRQRAALVLCFYEEYSNKEAADIMGVGVKAVESLLVRARRALKESLAGERT